MRNYVIKILLIFILIFCTARLQTHATSACIPKISVIIPIYNTSKFLTGCLDSVLGQSLRNIEIICINDGSTDNSTEIINEYAQKDSRIKVINQENKGGAAARNVGLKAAQGEFIAFIDSDDTIDKNAYQKSYEIAKKYNANILMFGESRIAMPDKVCIDGFDALNIPGAMMLWNKLYKRSFLEDNKFQIPEHISCYHDECFNSVVLPKSGCVMCIKDRFYHYRRKRTGSIQTSATLEKKICSILMYARCVYDFWQENDYIKEHGFWLLKYLSIMSNRVIKKIDINSAKHYSCSLMSIIEGEIYNSDNVTKLSDFEKKLLNNWIKYAE